MSARWHCEVFMRSSFIFDEADILFSNLDFGCNVIWCLLIYFLRSL